MTNFFMSTIPPSNIYFKKIEKVMVFNKSSQFAFPIKYIFIYE